MKKQALDLMDVLREIYENTMNGFIAESPCFLED